MHADTTIPFEGLFYLCRIMMCSRQGIRLASGWTHAAINICTQSGNIELVTWEIRQTAMPETAFGNASSAGHQHESPGSLIVYIMYCHCYLCNTPWHKQHR